MKKLLAAALVAISMATWAEGGKLVSIDEVDCTKAKTYAIRKQCEEDQASRKREEITKFKSVKKLFEYLNNFEFLVTDSKPVDITLFPLTNPNTERSEIKRAVLEGVYRTFIHTDESCVKLSIIPRNMKDIEYKKEVGLSVCREKALEYLRNVTHFENFNELVSNKEIAGQNFKDQWVKEFEKIYYGEYENTRDQLVNLLFGRNIFKNKVYEAGSSSYTSYAVSRNNGSYRSSGKSLSTSSSCPPGSHWVSGHYRKGNYVSGHCRSNRK